MKYNPQPYNTVYTAFDTGGYTGSGEGLAFLDKKELVLNSRDTSNILQAISMQRDLLSNISMNNAPTTQPIVYNINIEEVKTNDAIGLINNLKSIAIKG